MIRLVTEGHSWSGHERHVVYLNEGTNHFADISYLSGLDFEDDGRALGIADWDQDGDLDLWFRNRTAPRLRLLINRRSEAENRRNFVALRLESAIGNRDGIGAVVTVIPKDPSDSRAVQPITKSLRAGDLFLSQSSKWLHFGLGESDGIGEVRVLWPGGTEEVFSDLQAGGRYLLRQGAGVAVRLTGRSERPRLLSQNDVDWPLHLPHSEARILLPARVPLFPNVRYRDPAGRLKSLQTGEGTRLVLIWSASCPHCQKELEMLTDAAPQIRRDGIEVLALSADAVAEDDALPDTSDVYALMDRSGFPFAWGLIDKPSLERLDHLQNALFDRSIPLSVPVSLLLDKNNNVLAIYRGPVGIDALLEDVRSTKDSSDETLHHLAPPLAGQWFTNPVPRAYVAENLARQFQSRFPEDALAYLHLAAEHSDGEKRQALVRELAARHHALAREFREQNLPEKAVAYFQKALVYTPDAAEIHHDYGVLLASYGKLTEAEACFKTALQLDPDLQASREALTAIREIREGRR